MHATAREFAKVTLSELDAIDGEFLPERAVLSGVGMPGGGVPGGGVPTAGSNLFSGLLQGLIPAGALG